MCYTACEFWHRPTGERTGCEAHAVWWVVLIAVVAAVALLAAAVALTVVAVRCVVTVSCVLGRFGSTGGR